MKLISLTQGKFAQVDDKNFDKINSHKWYAHKIKSKNTNDFIFYARRSYMEGGVKKSIYMHRQIMNFHDKTIILDHKDHDGLNNQEDNLRVASKRNNAVNQRPMRGTSKYLGVSLYTHKNRKGDIIKQWKVQISISEGQRKHLGYFQYTDAGEIEAAKFYDLKAKEIYGEFANFNFKPQ